MGIIFLTLISLFLCTFCTRNMEYYLTPNKKKTFTKSLFYLKLSSSNSSSICSTSYTIFAVYAVPTHTCICTDRYLYRNEYYFLVFNKYKHYYQSLESWGFNEKAYKCGIWFSVIWTWLKERDDLLRFFFSFIALFLWSECRLYITHSYSKYELSIILYRNGENV